MAGAHRHALLVQQGAHVRRVGAVQQEGEHTHLGGGVADDFQAVEGPRLFAGGGQQRVLVGGQGGAVLLLQPAGGGAQADHAGDIGRARLEFVGQLIPGALFKAHCLDHLAAGLERRHCIEQLAAAEQHAHAGGAEHLVAGKRVEITADLLHVHRVVAHRLGAVHQGPGAGFAGRLDQFRHRGHRAQAVGHLGQRHDAGALAEQLVEGVGVDAAVLAQRRHLKRGAGALAHLLPGHDIGVVLQRGDQNLVAGLQPFAAQALRHQVDAFGGALGEDHFLAGGVDERRQVRAGRLEAGRGVVAEIVRRPVHVAVHGAVVLTHRVDHHLRFLGGGGVIQVHQRLAVDLLVQHRELRAQGVHVQAHAASSSAPRLWPSSPASQGWAQSATVWSGRPITSSLTKPRLSMRLASASGTPRACR